MRPLALLPLIFLGCPAKETPVRDCSKVFWRTFTAQCPDNKGTCAYDKVTWSDGSSLTEEEKVRCPKPKG